MAILNWSFLSWSGVDEEKTATTEEQGAHLPQIWFSEIPHCTVSGSVGFLLSEQLILISTASMSRMYRLSSAVARIQIIAVFANPSPTLPTRSTSRPVSSHAPIIPINDVGVNLSNLCAVIVSHVLFSAGAPGRILDFCQLVGEDIQLPPYMDQYAGLHRRQVYASDGDSNGFTSFPWFESQTDSSGDYSTVTPSATDYTSALASETPGALTIFSTDVVR